MSYLWLIFFHKPNFSQIPLQQGKDFPREIEVPRNTLNSPSIKARRCSWFLKIIGLGRLSSEAIKLFQSNDFCAQFYTKPQIIDLLKKPSD